MASVSSSRSCSSSRALGIPSSSSSPPSKRDSLSFPGAGGGRQIKFAADHRERQRLSASHSVPDGLAPRKQKTGLEKDPGSLWRRYVDWLYRHKELGMLLDVSRVGFSDDFVEEMEPRFQAAFKSMDELERGAIANPDEGRMVGHYWLRKPDLAPTPFLESQIKKTLDALCGFADDVVSGKIKPPSGGRFTQILSVGIGGSALGPQFVAEALAPDNPPLKIPLE